MLFRRLGSAPFVGCGFPNFSGVKSVCESVVLQPARDPAISAATRLVFVFMVVVFLWLRVWSFHLLDVEHCPRTVIEGFRWTVKAKMGNFGFDNVPLPTDYFS
jgi:hypothetical protein